MNNCIDFNCISCPARTRSAFSEIPDNFLVELGKTKVSNLYKKGQTIYYDGNKPYGVFCIRNGDIKISKSTSDGNKLVVKFSNSGSLLGYSSLLIDKNYSSTAEVIEDTHACFIDKQNFFDLLKKHSSFSLKLLTLIEQGMNYVEENSLNLALKSSQEIVINEVLKIQKDNFLKGIQTIFDFNFIGKQLHVIPEEVKSLLIKLKRILADLDINLFFDGYHEDLLFYHIEAFNNNSLELINKKLITDTIIQLAKLRTHNMKFIEVTSHSEIKSLKKEPVLSVGKASYLL